MLNYFGTLFLSLFSAEIQTFLMIFPATEDVCLQYIFSLFASMAFSFSILCMQTDRFLAIYWNIHYKDRVTTSRAVIACSLSLLMCIIVSCGMTIVDKSYSKCLFPVPLLHTRTTNISLEGIPRLMAFFATVLISLYAVWMDKQLAKVLPGPVNLPSVSQPTRVVEARYVQRLNSDPHVFFVTDARNLEVLQQQQSIHEVESMHVVESDDNADTTCTTTFVIMLKNTTTVNLISLVYLVTFPLTVILGMIYSNCEYSDQCADYLFLYECITPFRVLCMIVSLVLILKRLSTKDYVL